MRLRRALGLLLLVAPFASCGSGREQPDPAPPRPPEDAGPAPERAEPAPTDASEDASEPADADEPPREDPLEAYRLLALARGASPSGDGGSDLGATLGRARDAAPSDAFIRLELAEACLGEGDAGCCRREAGAALERAGDAPDLGARAHFLVGQALEREGDRDGARVAYVDSLRLRASRAVAARLAGLSAEAAAPTAGSVVACTRSRPEDSPCMGAARSRAETRGRSACALLERAHEEAAPGGVTLVVEVVAALEPHREAPQLLASEASLGASGSFPLLLVAASRGQPRVVVLDDGRTPGREAELVLELASEVRRITLGPGRPGLVVELATRGYWGVGPLPDRGAFSFERNELFVLGLSDDRMDLIARQVTRESGFVEVEDCLRGHRAEPVGRGGTLWLEDLNLSGVPEICQQSTELRPRRPEWMGSQALGSRRSASCQGWVASDLRRFRGPVPSLALDQFDEERAIHQVLEVSRVPLALHNALRPHLRGGVLLTAQALELTRSGMHGLAVVAGESSVSAIAISAGDAVNNVDLGEVGRWTEIWARIETPEAQLVTVEITARGNQTDGLDSRTWLTVVASGPGQMPTLALSHEVGRAHPEDHDPCPAIETSRTEHESRDGVPSVEVHRTRRTGPGTRAVERAREALCARLRPSTGRPTAADRGDTLPTDPLAICPEGESEIGSSRFVQGADRRFLPVTLP